MPLNTQYEDLLRDVLEHGATKSDRTGTGTISRFGAQLRYDLSQGFPLITTKRVWFKGLAHELLWMLSGDTNIGYLLDNDIHIWDQWALPDGTIGRGYGAQWRSWDGPDGVKVDQIAALVDSLRNNPDSRRHIVSAWNVAMLDKMALVPCHAFFQFDVTDGRLSCQLYQRSADLFLGVPFNIGFYSLLTHMLAQQVGLKVGDFVWTGGDCHIYANHVEQVREQLSRQVYEFPTLNLLRKPESIFDYRFEDFEVVGYRHHPTIKAPVAV